MSNGARKWPSNLSVEEMSIQLCAFPRLNARSRFSGFASLSFLFRSPTHWFGSQTLKHPNIVRLYDVIETDKYIGIILEYASGGELFDHILAHRYLKERDAAKLFSQLISGVWYIHQKKIVHRDLKLENLLLDRNRNVIITDFGFANRFEHKADDLMRTSCGSPCYAAPELVISEGLYVGSAVDIWSCGVILYAMLAGYLPFDDDPANPDGDNINLLYKYIVSTPLSFPDYISTEARELLSMMLVPDPTRRANLDSVMRHPWLSVHAGSPRTDGSPSAFGKTVDELEKAALDQHQQRRLAYQRQMRAAAAAAASQSNASHGREATHPGVPSRSRSTQPEYLYESSADQGISPPPAAVRSNTATGTGTSAPIGAPVAGNKPTFGSPTAQGITPDDPFAHPASSSVGATAMTVNSSTAKISENVAPTQGHKHNSSGSGFRHTIQVEYDDRSNRRDERRTRMGTDYQHSQMQPKPQQPQLTPSTPTIQDRRVTASTSAGKPLPVPPPSSTAPSASTKLSTSPAVVSARAQERQQQLYVNSSRTDAQKSSANVPSSSSPDPATDKETSSVTSSIGKKSITHEQPVQSPASPSQSKGHKKGKSSTDRFALTKIFGSGNNVRDSADALARDEKEKEKARVKGSPLIASPERYGGEKESKLSPPPTSAPMEKEKEKGRDKENKGRRNTLTVMVEPISRTIRGGKISASKTPTSVQPTNHGNTSFASLAPPSLRSQPLSSSIPGTPTSSSRGTITAESKGAIDGGSSAASTGEKDYNIAATATATTAASVNDESGNSASSNKAKKVMAWFRAKSKGRDSMLGSSTAAASNRSISHSSREDDQGQGQMVVGGASEGFAMMLTTPTSTTTRIPQTPGTNGSRHTPGYPKRTASTNTENSMMSFSTSGIVQKIRHSVGVGNSVSSTPSGSSKIRSGEGSSGNNVDSSKKPHEKLRIHHGAVDQTTITTRPPVEVMNHVKEILEGMGVEIYKESEFKYRCVRQKRKKGIVNSVDGSDRGMGQEDVAVFTMAGSAASDGVCFSCFPVSFLPFHSSYLGNPVGWEIILLIQCVLSF